MAQPPEQHNASPDAASDQVPPDVRFVKRLVVVLTSVMVVGLVVIVTMLAIRLSTPPTAFALPDAIRLPEGVRAEAVTLSADWVLVLTDGDEMLVFARTTGELRDRIALQAAPE